MVDTAMQPEVVRARLTALENLLDDVDSQFGPLRTVQDRQGAAMWTDIPACRHFAQEYTDRLGELEQALVGLRASVQVLLVNLALGARDLTRTEDDIRERMVALAERLNAMPVVVAPGSLSPATETSGGGYGGTMSGGYAPTTPSVVGTGPMQAV